MPRLYFYTKPNRRMPKVAEWCVQGFARSRGRSKTVSIYVSPACSDDAAVIANVLGHELAHHLTFFTNADSDTRTLAGDCAPDREIIADSIGRKMAVAAGFKGVLLGYEEQCGITRFFEDSR